MDLSGRLLNDAGAGISGATVELYAVDGSDLPTGAALDSDTTDANGRWDLTLSAIGTKYAVKITNGSHIRYIDGADKAQLQSLDVTTDLTGPGGAPLSHATCEGRLTLATGTPVTTADQTAKTTLYFTPYRGNRIALYDGTYWKLYTFTERSLDISALLADTNYDIWLYNNSGTLTLEALAWTNSTTRATALATQDGVYCKTGALTRRYLGTIRMTSVLGQCEDSDDFRGVWNYYNRVPRRMLAKDGTDSWEYTTATWRAANANTTGGVGRVEFVVGVAEDLLEAVHHGLTSNTTGGVGAATGIALDATNTSDAQIQGGTSNAQASTLAAFYRAVPAVGYHYLQRTEISAATGTTTWYGDSGVAYIASGLIATILG